jgi:SAM-dependent methyltransferase
MKDVENAKSVRTADGLRWYQLVYRTLYRVGLVFWQRNTPPAGLVTLVEGYPPLPPGRALDIGCGTGTDTIYLATHGWHVTGIDMVPKALSIARRRAAAAGVAPHFVDGDVTRLQHLGMGEGFTLLLDFGCFHTLPEDRRAAYVTSVSGVAASGATLLLYGFRRPISPMHAGVTLEEVKERFGGAGWELINAERASNETLPVRVANRFELWRYQLRRS